MAETPVVNEAIQNEPKEPNHVFDLPQLYNKPSAALLLSATSLLARRPRSWSPTRHTQNSIESSQPCQISSEGIASYLTSIIASPLGWIQDDVEKEAIWESASRRLAEHSGRAAMPAMERAFSIPRKNDVTEPECEYVKLLLHEPSLTADNLGFKTWGASYLLSKRLHQLDFPALRAISKALESEYPVLELGSGTGLVGMAAAAVLEAGVVLTDLPDIEPNLAHNVQANSATIQRCGGAAVAGVLDWSNPSSLSLSSPPCSVIAAASDTHSEMAANAISTPPISSPATSGSLPSAFPIILVADPIYDSAHPAFLVSTIITWLSKTSVARVVVELPLRSVYSDSVKELRDRLRDAGLVLLEHGEETGIDDWGGDGEDEATEVQCWWGVWGWEDADR